jgi:hypothetical protein
MERKEAGVAGGFVDFEAEEGVETEKHNTSCQHHINNC